MSTFVMGPPLLPQQKETEKNESENVDKNSTVIIDDTRNESDSDNSDAASKGPLNFDDPHEAQLRFTVPTAAQSNSLLDEELKSSDSFGEFECKTETPIEGKRPMSNIDYTVPKRIRQEIPSETETSTTETERKQMIVQKAASKYTNYKCTICDYTGYTPQLLNAHRRLRNHYPSGPPPPAFSLPRFPLISSIAPRRPLMFPPRPVFASPPSATLPFRPLIPPLLTTPDNATPIGTAELTNAQLIKNLELALERTTKPDNETQTKKDDSSTMDTQDMLTNALKRNDFTTAKELAEVLEKERELQKRKEKLAIKTTAEMPASSQLKDTDKFNEYWALKKASICTASEMAAKVEVLSETPKQPIDIRSFSYKKQQILQNDTFPGAILAYMSDDPTYFWIRLPNSDQMLHEIDRRLAEVLKSNSVTTVVRPTPKGLGCIAVVDFDDKCHRVEVIEQFNNGDICIRLVDVGRLMTLSNLAQLKYLPVSDDLLLETPCLAVPCSLVHFQASKRWQFERDLCSTAFRTALSGTIRLKMLSKSERGVYGIESYSNQGQSLLSYLIAKGLALSMPRQLFGPPPMGRGPLRPLVRPPGFHRPPLNRPIFAARLQQRMRHPNSAWNHFFR